MRSRSATCGAMPPRAGGAGIGGAPSAPRPRDAGRPEYSRPRRPAGRRAGRPDRPWRSGRPKGPRPARIPRNRDQPGACRRARARRGDPLKIPAQTHEIEVCLQDRMLVPARFQRKAARIWAHFCLRSPPCPARAVRDRALPRAAWGWCWRLASAARRVRSTAPPPNRPPDAQRSAGPRRAPTPSRVTGDIRNRRPAQTPPSRIYAQFADDLAVSCGYQARASRIGDFSIPSGPRRQGWGVLASRASEGQGGLSAQG
jgi:hypothetical protein